MKNELPELGSQWEHHSGRIYTVLGTANIKQTDHLAKYPVTVVYVGKNGNLWTKLIDNFLKTMTEIV